MKDEKKSMETPVNHWEYKDLKELIESKTENLKAEDKRLNERLKIVEDTTRQINSINITLQKQSDNITAISTNFAKMVEKQEEESDRIRKLEDKDGEKWRKMWGYIIPPLVTLLVGIIAGRLGLA